MPSKEYRRGTVKKTATSRQRTFETLARSISRMDVDYGFELADHPNWMRALDRETGENPVDVEVNRRLDDLATKTRAQMKIEYVDRTPYNSALRRIEYVDRTGWDANHDHNSDDLGRSVGPLLSPLVARFGLLTAFLDEIPTCGLGVE